MTFRIETAYQARSRQHNLIRQLERRGTSAAEILAKKLARCTSENRCESGACAVCMRIARRQLMEEAPPFLGGREVFRVSWIPKGSSVGSNNLNRFDLTRFTAAVLRALQRTLPPRSILVGGLDISYNVIDNGEPYWQIHGYALAAVPRGYASGKIAVIRRLLRKLPLDERSSRPLHLVQVESDDDYGRILSYAFKNVFYKRSSYHYLRKSTGRRTRNTRAQALPSAAAVELALFLDRFPLSKRLLLIGLRRHGRGVNLTLRPTGLSSR